MKALGRGMNEMMSHAAMGPRTSSCCAVHAIDIKQRRLSLEANDVKRLAQTPQEDQREPDISGFDEVASMGVLPGQCVTYRP